jgi:multiple sugar transport system substrate-binding protein
MKQKRRRLGLGLAAIGVVGALALSGCSNPATGSEDITLTIWHYYNTDGQVEGLKHMAEGFEAKHPEVTVEFAYVPVDQFTTKAVTAAGAKTGPDVLVYGASGTYSLAEAGAIEPMDDWWGEYADKDQFPEGVMQRVDGKLYGVQGYVNLLGLWYNQDLLDQLGADVPTTIDEMEAVMKDAVAAGKQGVTLTGKPGLESQWQGFPWFTSHGFSYGDPEAAPMADTYTMLQDWVAKGYLSKEAATWDQTKELAQEFLQDTFFSVNGELILLDTFGAIPGRADAAADPKIGDDPILSVFATIVQQQGRPSPSPEVPSKNVNAVETLVGDYWSRAVANDGSPKDLANELLDQLVPLLKG